MTLVCSHLKKQGHNRGAYVGPEGRPISDGRRAAFEQASTREGFEFFTMSTGDARDEKAGLEAATIALDREPRPTAIVCFNDNVAFGVQSAVSRGVRQGRPDVAVTGYDNTYIAQFDRIALTSVSQNVAEVVRRACAILGDPEEYARWAGSEILVEPELVVRSSTTSLGS